MKREILNWCICRFNSGVDNKGSKFYVLHRIRGIMYIICGKDESIHRTDDGAVSAGSVT